MYRCMNAMCAKTIKRDKPHYRADVVGNEEHWCNETCFEEWRQHNAVFVKCADPFERRVHTHSEHRRRHY